MRNALASVAAIALLALRAAADEPEPAAAELARRAAAQAFGGDAVEVWKSEWNDEELVFGVARRHDAGKLQLFVRVLAPHKYEPLSFLLLPGSDGGPIIEYYLSPRLFGPDRPFGPDRRVGRTLELQVASAVERLPFAPGLPALAELWPPRAEGASLARLADESSDGTPCRVLERRLREPDGPYDRVVTLLARDSNVALESRFFLGDKLVRRVVVAAKDVDRSGERAVVRRRVVEEPGEADQVLSLERFSPDPVFPDQLFTSQNLRTGRFPSY
jgi:hypothetical protein